MRIDVQNAILLLLCLVLLLSVFSLSASAAGSFVELSSSLESLGSAGSFTFSANTLSGTVYVCWSMTNRSGGQYQGPTFFSESPASIHLERHNLNNVNDNYVIDYDFILDDEYGFYYCNEAFVPSNLETQTSLAVYSSFADAMEAFSSIANSSSFSYTLPPGNVAYIPIPRGMTGNITFTLTTTYYMAFGNNDTSRINQVVTVMSSLPSSSNNIAPSSPKIPWTNNGNVNLLGVSANKIYQGSIPSNYGGQYLVIVNPMTMPSQTGLIGGDTYTNGSINISVSSVSGSPHIYPMTESLTITPGDGIGSESSYGDTGYTYEVDPETGEVIWTDPFGGSSAPVAGGNNPMPSPNTIFDWLRNISQQFSDFLRGPVQAVQVVVSAIRDFMGSFTQLYQWLPSPVYSLITSALMIALTIGVIKIFV